jgi:hypothetical protein
MELVGWGVHNHCDLPLHCCASAVDSQQNLATIARHKTEAVRDRLDLLTLWLAAKPIAGSGRSPTGRENCGFVFRPLLK